jgi:hypothetical protein
MSLAWINQPVAQLLRRTRNERLQHISRRRHIRARIRARAHDKEPRHPRTSSSRARGEDVVKVRKMVKMRDGETPELARTGFEGFQP